MFCKNVFKIIVNHFVINWMSKNHLFWYQNKFWYTKSTLVISKLIVRSSTKHHEHLRVPSIFLCKALRRPSVLTHAFRGLTGWLEFRVQHISQVYHQRNLFQWNPTPDFCVCLPVWDAAFSITYIRQYTHCWVRPCPLYRQMDVVVQSNPAFHILGPHVLWWELQSSLTTPQ